MQPALPLQPGSATSPGLRVGRTQGSHLYCSTVAPGSCQAAKGNRREKGSHTNPQLHAYLRAERCLLVEIAPHKFTILPGGYFTPGGGRVTKMRNKAHVEGTTDHPVPSQATRSPLSRPKSAYKNRHLQLPPTCCPVSAPDALIHSQLSPVPLSIHPSGFSPTGKHESPPQTNTQHTGAPAEALMPS